MGGQTHERAHRQRQYPTKTMPYEAYHGFAMREVSVNSTSLYETNWFSIKGFSCLSRPHSHINWFCLKKLNVFSQHFGKKKQMNIWIPQNKSPGNEMFLCQYCVRYYLMMQHQPIVKRVNGTHEWAHRPYQLLSAPCHCCLYKHSQQDERQPLQSSWPLPICT